MWAVVSFPGSGDGSLARFESPPLWRCAEMQSPASLPSYLCIGRGQAHTSHGSLTEAFFDIYKHSSGLIIVGHGG